MFRRFGSLALGLALLLVATNRCGQKVCVAGIGECSATPIEEDKDNPNLAKKQFRIKLSKTEVLEGDTVEITAENSSEKWEVLVVDGPSPLELPKTDKFKYTFRAPEISGTLETTKFRGKDMERFKSEGETPYAFDEISLKIRQKTLD